jgi:FkbM family methyltransferase
LSDHDRSYWGKLCALVRSADRAQPLFIDGGANRGDFTAQLMGEFPDCSVHAVEPNPDLCAGLGQRFAGKKVRIWNAALHEHEGKVDLQVHANAATSSVLPRPVAGRRYFDSSDRVVATVTVDALSLDRLAGDAAIEHVDLLKLDTQGAELPIIRGAKRLLQSAAIDVIYTEFFVVPHYEGAATLHELWAALDAHGYVLYDVFKGPYGRNGQLRFGDAIFVSPKVRERYLDRFPDES